MVAAFRGALPRVAGRAFAGHGASLTGMQVSRSMLTSLRAAPVMAAGGMRAGAGLSFALRPPASLMLRSTAALGGVGSMQVRGMRHRMKRGRLGRPAKHRKDMLRNMVTDLIKHERIRTTVPKAKVLKRLADKMVTLGKKATLNARRECVSILRTKESLYKVFDVLGPRYEGRHGGYTRVLRCIKNRAGDNAPMAWIEYIDRPGELRTPKPGVLRLPYSIRLAGAEEKGDSYLAEYYQEMQEAEVAARAKSLRLLEPRKMPTGPRPRAPHPEAQM